jgi:hypothetical protein
MRTASRLQRRGGLLPDPEALAAAGPGLTCPPPAASFTQDMPAAQATLAGLCADVPVSPSCPAGG